MPFKFDYKEMSLTATDDHIDEAAVQVFTEWAEESLDEAIECACGSFWKEGQANALACLTGAGDFWKYLKENTCFFESKEVVEKAAQLSIEDYERR